MPSCFSLTKRGDTEPSSLQYIDRVLCQSLDIPYSEDSWACGWYNFIGLSLAIGHSFEYLIDLCWKHEEWNGLRIAAYLNEHYVSDSWREFR
jgi:hypothetical protein